MIDLKTIPKTPNGQLIANGYRMFVCDHCSAIHLELLYDEKSCVIAIFDADEMEEFATAALKMALQKLNPKVN